ncbi:MAG: hypothetical protein ACP5NF_01710 [Thermoanaerobaculum sp.]
MDYPAATVEHALQAPEVVGVYLTPGDRGGGWRAYFGETAARVPAPFWLYGEDERTILTLGFPFQVTSAWEGFCRELSRLAELEARYRLAQASRQGFDKHPLVGKREEVAAAALPLFANAFEQDFDRLFPEILWLALSREISVRFSELRADLVSWAPGTERAALAKILYLAAQRVIETLETAEHQACQQVKARAPWVNPEAGRRFAQLLRQDLVPFVSLQATQGQEEVDLYLAGKLGLEPQKFRQVLAEKTEGLDTLRQKDPGFVETLALLDPEAPSLPSRDLLFHLPTLRLLSVWRHPATPRFSAELFALLEDLGGRFRRFEVVSALSARILPVASHGSRLVAKSGSQLVRLSPSVRAMDFTSPTVVPSAVRRYGLVYDLVEFTRILEELRRFGLRAELSGLRFMLRFQHAWEQIRSEYRLRLEKFLGDGAFYSSRSAKAVFQAAVRGRLVYESLREQGCPFDRGLRMALNVGTYHLLPMVGGAKASFEFFGQGLVELSRLTTGKSSKEVEEIADFLVARGYDLHQVLEFLEPVRHRTSPERLRESRPYGAYLLENGELQNLGTVLTEAFLRELELEWTNPRVGEVEAWGQKWLVVMTHPDGGPWAGLRFLGVTHLKGLEPFPLYEMVAWEEAPPGLSMLPPGTPILKTLRTLGAQVEGLAATVRDEPDPRLCVASCLEDDGRRAWYLGLWYEETDALHGAFRVPLMPPGLEEGEPFEAWLFRNREELAKLYQALRRKSAGAMLPLDHLRHRDGYLACLLTSPQRSPR